MSWKLCPKCEINYIDDNQVICNVCANIIGQTNNAAEKPIIKHKEFNIFMFFQGKEYYSELKYGYISAPYKDAGGKSPSHWTMLENVKPGDVIFHGLSQCISAISVATSQCFTSTMRNGITEGRRVNCSPVLIKHTIATSECLDVILETCTKYKYQPFDKNGNGRQGYLFDLNDKLAGAFTRVLAQKNPDLLRKIPQLAIMLNY